MNYKYFDGIIQKPEELEDIDKSLINDINELKNIVSKQVDSLNVGEAISDLK
jgi:hypothetical protein